jgi:hypothetical protein
LLQQEISSGVGMLHYDLFLSLLNIHEKEVLHGITIRVVKFHGYCFRVAFPDILVCVRRV